MRWTFQEKPFQGTLHKEKRNNSLSEVLEGNLQMYNPQILFSEQRELKYSFLVKKNFL